MMLRNKLVTLLLIVSVVPFALTFGLRQWSGGVVRTHVSDQIEVTLDQYARSTLTQWIEEYQEVFRRDVQLDEALIRRQARELVLLTPADGNETVVWDEVSEVYAEIQQQALSDYYRQITVWNDGTCQIVPDSPAVPGHDLREELWYQQAVQNPGVVRLKPVIEPNTGQYLINIALAVRDAQGEVLAVTLLQRTVAQLFEHVVMPMQWGDAAEFIGVVVDLDTVTSNPGLNVVLTFGYNESFMPVESGQVQVALDDSEVSRHMIDEMLLGQAGIQRMIYEGRDTLWAYGHRTPSGVIPVVLIAYDEVTKLASNVEDFIMGQSDFWWTLGGSLLLIIVALVLWVGFVRAASLVEPIKVLTAASAQLAAGDYQAHIDIRTQDELQTLGEAFNEIGPHLQERELLKSSLEIAGAIQRSLLPQEDLQLDHFEIAGRCVYCDQSGGDYYDFIALDEPERLGIALGDVTGHGIGAALLMATARGIFRSLAHEYQHDLAGLLTHFNRQFVPDCDSDKFITLFYGLLDSRDRSLTWASGGHDPAIWYHCQTDTFEELPNTGPLLGIIEGVNYRQSGPVHLVAGDILLVGTDGIWESSNESRERFGQERLRHLVQSNRDQSAADLCAGITQAVQDFVAPLRPEDDITLVVIKTL